MTRTPAAFIIVIGALLAGCAAPPPAIGLLDVTERPGEKALLAGLRAYEDAQYTLAEQQLQLSLSSGLVSSRDRAAAHKILAFVYCTSKRVAACEAEFRAAIEANPNFALSKSEAGHPQWGPVYQRVRQ